VSWRPRDGLRRLRRGLQNVRRIPELLEYERGWPPGHFYSPIPSLDEVRRREEAIFAHPPRELPGVDLHETGQLALFREIAPFYASHTFAQGDAGGRFSIDNPNFNTEAVLLQCLIRHLRPARIVEVGSGHSSCAILDTNELFFDGGIACTFIEPHPELLRSLLRPGDEAAIVIIDRPLQDVPTERFRELGRGDLLLVDSTHVAKVDSDVNHLLFRVLPSLASGSLVHFHDVHYPFEYPREWVLEGRAWNEAYVLRAFLQYNGAFEIAFFNSFFGCFHHDLLAAEMPLCAENPGSSLWLRRR
jgi:hypothetical protein